MERKSETMVGLLTLLVVALLVFTVTPLTPTSGLQEGLETMGKICVWGDFHDKGQNIFLGCSKNTVTNIAKNETRDMRMYLNQGSQTHNATRFGNWTVLQLSTDATPANATATTCGLPVTGNGLDIAQGSVSVISTTIGNYSVTYKWAATGSQASIAKVCLHNQTTPTSTPLLASAVLSSIVSLETNENLTVVYYIAET